MATIENEAKKLAATYARWLRLPEDALFGRNGEGPIRKMYKKINEAKNKDDIREILNISQYEMQRQTFNDLTRFANELLSKIGQMSDEDALKFTKEVFKYFQIDLATKIENIRSGNWA
ncbi:MULTISPECIES: hypothetical protein [Acidianus]|uniref:CRISPR type III-B/RAMP module-associated protein Cmr5 n=1 Tax=Candidatus Acidianus copahuensis TaxID=1160895 RepID=A0A031LPK6_9CREN|nr:MULTISPECIES: hypothetical protein [Acidianus]EZQ07017.1 hypothetical protein CM19_06570 [Candidatus Acidianus copahuensis]NON61176.1 hypothetical protein [Acidianus sp. RZ1]